MDLHYFTNNEREYFINKTDERNQIIINTYDGEIEKVENSIKNGFDVNTVFFGYNNYTLLVLAIIGGQFEMCKKLLELGANIHYINNRDKNLVFMYLQTKPKKKNIKILEFLLENGCIVETKYFSSLVDRLQKENIQELELLIKYGANVNYVGKDGKSLLHFAVENKGHKIFDPSIIQLLIENGADILARDKYGRRPSYYIGPANFMGFNYNEYLYAFLIQKQQERIEFLQGFKRAQVSADDDDCEEP